MHRGLPHFRPSYGDPVEERIREAGASGKALSPGQWLLLHKGENWADDAGYVFTLIDATRIKLTYTPAGRATDKRFTLGDGKAEAILSTLQAKGRRVPGSEMNTLLSISKSKAATPAFVASPMPEVAAPLAPAPTSPQRRPAPQPVYKRAWFPLAVAGGGLALLGVIAVVLRSRKQR